MIASAFSVLVAVQTAYAATYPIVDSFAGGTFLDGWNIPAAPNPSTPPYDDTTSGDVFWAAKDNSSVFRVNNDGRVILKVDNESFVPYNEKRFAPKLESKNAYQIGSVFVMDAVRMPWGCGVWPAFWTAALSTWPNGGEIDIMEGVNMQQTNQYALHTEGDGCYADSSAQMLGTFGFDNCSIGANYGAGCTVVDKNQNSYGVAFAQAGGGAYIMELTTDFIKIWFKTRSEIPSSMKADAKEINTDELGTPSAFYPNTRCNIDKYFGAQNMVIDITMCGVWAGAKDTLQQTCPQLEGRGFDPSTALGKRILSANSTEESCYLKYVINDQGAALANAYFELNYINVFSKAGVIRGDVIPGGNSTDAPGASGTSQGGSKTSMARSGARTGSGGEVIGSSNSDAVKNAPIITGAAFLGSILALLLL